jgi:hypothetical protein
MTQGNDPPKTLTPRETTALALLVIVVGALAFAAFSFLTFGVPLLVVAVGGLIWIYVGIMRWVDRAFVKRAQHPPNRGDSQ